MATYVLLPLVILLWIVDPAAGREQNITCLPSEECILPCKFSSDGKGARIMWYKRLAVVSCTRYGNTSFVVGHNSPADKYRGRTDLYSERVLEGNATLVLRDVTPHDEGKYFCVTWTAPRTDQSGVINLNVKAPVEDVAMEFTEDTVLCKAKDVYPVPKLSWSVDPSEGARLLRNKTKISRNQRGFFDIQSSLILMDGDRNRTFICSISSDGRNRTSFLKQEGNPIQVPHGGDATLLCNFPPVAPRSFNLTWRLTHLDPILSMRVWGQGSQVEVWDRWKAHVPDSPSAAGSLKVKDLDVQHQGTYTCEVRTAEETYITKTHVDVYPVIFIITYIIIIIVLVFLLFLSLGVVTYLCCKVKQSQASRPHLAVTEDTDELIRGSEGQASLVETHTVNPRVEVCCEDVGLLSEPVGWHAGEPTNMDRVHVSWPGRTNCETGAE